MIAYLIKFTLCSGLLLAVYHLLLKNKVMYNFNRAFLLLAVIFSLVIPLISINQQLVGLPARTVNQPALTNNFIYVQGLANPISAADSSTNKTFYRLSILYGLVTLLLVYRFIKNLYLIHSKIVISEIVNYRDAKLVLIEQSLTPHTFFNYIFLNKTDYLNNQIENEIIQHELAHVKQHHSADIIFIELIQALCWFNPFIIFYRKAIQLNHEFIADGVVLSNNHNLTSYQTLLFSKASQTRSLTITSQFNYSITKKRLIMMSKTTSAATAGLTSIALILLLATAFVLFCNKTDAQQDTSSLTKNNAEKPAVQQKREPTIVNYRWPSPDSRNYPSRKEGLNSEMMTEYKAIVAKYDIENSPANTRPKQIYGADKLRLEQLFKQMSIVQQQEQIVGFTYRAGPMGANSPTKAQLSLWKNAETYGVWVDDKRIDNAQLSGYSPADFKMVMMSNLTQKAILNDGFKVQITLMTAKYYRLYYDDEMAHRYDSMIYYAMTRTPKK